jgi:hypothetical protein
MKNLPQLHTTNIRLSEKHLGEQIRKALVDSRNNKNKDILLEIKGPNEYIEAYVKPTVFGKHSQPFKDIAEAFAEKVEKMAILSTFLEDWAGLEQFHKLKYLTIGIESSDKASHKDFPIIDFSNYPYLEGFATWGLWNTRNLQTSNIKELIYIAYGQNKQDLSASQFPLQLRRLEIKHDALSSLSGVETAKNLEEIELFYLRSLKDISALEKLTHLKFLFINKNCPKIEFDTFPYLPSLKKLYIATNIPSLAFLHKVPNLEDFGCWNDIKDNDMSPILDLKHLKSCYFKTTKKSSYSYEQICQLKNIIPVR